MAVAFVALLAALSGTAVALPGVNIVDSGDVKNNSIRSNDLRNNDVRSGDIRNSSITGSDVRNDSLAGTDINESSLAKVPSAGTADSANTANSAASAASANRANSAADADTVVRSGGYTALTEGESTTLISRGPLSVVAACAASATSTVATTFIATTADGSVFSSWQDGSEGFGPATPETDRQVSSDTDAAGGGIISDGWYVSADAPGTNGIAGMIGILVNADANRCQFNFAGTAL